MIRVCVVYAPTAREVYEVPLSLAEPSCVLDALQLSGLLQSFPELNPQKLLMGVWGRQVGLTHALRDQDRVEICRPLRVDPKVARRERFVKQGARAAGLFVKKRPGAKAGY
ncbi:RnfH family protein [Rhodoferax sp. BLA1]|uniref:RnfH family protein n=1 Tax=Rhodoferax sp. BLA1 TaxID=2576062 RepID=UPI0015D1DD8F